MAIFTANKIMFLSVSSPIIFPPPSFLEMELKQIYPSLTIQYTTIWMSAGMRGALRIAHLVPTAQAELRNAQCVPPKQWLFISCTPTTKQPFKLCFGFQHFTPRAGGNTALCPETLKF